MGLNHSECSSFFTKSLFLYAMKITWLFIVLLDLLKTFKTKVLPEESKEQFDQGLHCVLTVLHNISLHCTGLPIGSPIWLIRRDYIFKVGTTHSRNSFHLNN